MNDIVGMLRYYRYVVLTASEMQTLKFLLTNLNFHMIFT